MNSDPLVLQGVSRTRCEPRDELAVGVVGCGLHSTTAILPSLRHAGLRLIAACDLDLQRAERAMRLFGGQVAYPTLDDLLARGDLDAVIVVGPPDLHVRAGVAALESGHHVFIEKPPGTSLADALILQETARRAGRQVMVGFMKRHATAYRLVAQIVADPAFGRVTSVDMTYAHWPVSGVRAHLVDMSIHAIDTVRWLLGDPVRISTYKRPVGGNHVISLMIEHADGVSHLDLSALQPGVQERLAVAGEGAVVTVENLLRLTYVRQADELPAETPNSRLTRSWSPELALPDAENDMQVLMGYATELIEFGNAIREGRSVSPSIDDGVAAMRLIESIVAAPDGLSIATLEQQ